MVSEQFPPEVEARRKKLYPVLRRAKRDGKSVSLVRDRLYIDGELYKPDDEVPVFETVGPRRGYRDVLLTTPVRNNEPSNSERPYKRNRVGSSPVCENTHL